MRSDGLSYTTPLLASTMPGIFASLSFTVFASAMSCGWSLPWISTSIGVGVPESPLMRSSRIWWKS